MSPEIHIRLDHARFRMCLRLEGAVSGRMYRARMGAHLRAHPETLAYDRIYDLLRYTGSIDHADIQHLAELQEALTGGRVTGGATVLVTRDAGFRFWAGVFRHQFPSRRFHVAASAAEAEALLSQEDPARPGR